MTEGGGNITPHVSSVTEAERERLLGQRGCVLWLTGLSGSGKSTIAHAVERRLVDDGRPAFVLDGDNLRTGLNANLGFSPEDRQENVRRAACAAGLLASGGLLTIAALISPYRADRDAARQAVGRERFLEIFVDTPLDLCESRDPKGLYKKARSGEIPSFTGVSAPYEMPDAPDLRIPTAEWDIARAVDELVRMLTRRGFLGPDS